MAVDISCRIVANTPSTWEDRCSEGKRLLNRLQSDEIASIVLGVKSLCVVLQLVRGALVIEKRDIPGPVN